MAPSGRRSPIFQTNGASLAGLSLLWIPNKSFPDKRLRGDLQANSWLLGQKSRISDVAKSELSQKNQGVGRERHSIQQKDQALDWSEARAHQICPLQPPAF